MEYAVPNKCNTKKRFSCLQASSSWKMTFRIIIGLGNYQWRPPIPSNFKKTKPLGKEKIDKPSADKVNDDKHADNNNCESSEFLGQKFLLKAILMKRLLSLMKHQQQNNPGRKYTRLLTRTTKKISVSKIFYNKIQKNL